MNVLVGVVISRIKFITCGQSECRTVSGRMELHRAPVVSDSINQKAGRPTLHSVKVCIVVSRALRSCSVRCGVQEHNSSVDTPAGHQSALCDQG